MTPNERILDAQGRLSLLRHMIESEDVIITSDLISIIEVIIEQLNRAIIDDEERKDTQSQDK